MPDTTMTIETYKDGVLIATSTRDLPPEQIAAATIRERAVAGLTANATYLALAAPTNAQVAAQVKALTKECNGLIRLLLGRLDDITGT